jgi:hypothetical protein
MDWKKLKIVLKLSKNRHAGTIVPDSISGGAFYFPAPRDKGRKQKMKIYWIFKNEPSAKISEYRANTKTEALKMYNADHETNLKIKKENPFSAVCIAEKTAYLHYNFRLFSYAE